MSALYLSPRWLSKPLPISLNPLLPKNYDLKIESLKGKEDTRCDISSSFLMKQQIILDRKIQNISHHSSISPLPSFFAPRHGTCNSRSRPHLARQVVFFSLLHLSIMAFPLIFPSVSFVCLSLRLSYCSPFGLSSPILLVLLTLFPCPSWLLPVPSILSALCSSRSSPHMARQVVFFFSFHPISSFSWWSFFELSSLFGLFCLSFLLPNNNNDPVEISISTEHQPSFFYFPS